MAPGPRGSSGPGRGKPSSGRASSRPRGTGRSSAAPAGKPAAPTGAGGSRFTMRAAVLHNVMVMLIASYSSYVHTWWQQRQEIRAEEARIETTKKAIEDLEEEMRRWDDPAFVAQQARERFGWVLPGEVGYRVIDADGNVEGDGPQLSEVPSDAPPQWYDQLWTSVQLAGEEPVVSEEPTDGPDEPLGQEPSE